MLNVDLHLLEIESRQTVNSRLCFSINMLDQEMLDLYLNLVNFYLY